MLPITRKISAYNFYPGNTVEYIVLHDVGALGQALANANYFQVERGASAHYFTDDNTIVQVVEDFNGAWHVGDGYNKYGINNKNSIGIEMCLTAAWKVSAATQQNTVDLVHHLKAKYPNAKIVRHYDASRKNCPGSMSANNWAEWNVFRLRLETGASAAVVSAAKFPTTNINATMKANTHADKICGSPTRIRSFFIDAPLVRVAKISIAAISLRCIQAVYVSL